MHEAVSRQLVPRHGSTGPLIEYFAMGSVTSVVREILSTSFEVRYCLSHKLLNLAAYATQIHDEVEKRTNKRVRVSTISMALSRIQADESGRPSVICEAPILNVIVQSPIIQTTYAKNERTRKMIAEFQSLVGNSVKEWSVVSSLTSFISVIATESAQATMDRISDESPVHRKTGLVAIETETPPADQGRPGALLSTIYPFALQKIPIFDLTTSRGELVFVIENKYLNEAVALLHKAMELGKNQLELRRVSEASN